MNFVRFFYSCSNERVSLVCLVWIVCAQDKGLCIEIWFCCSFLCQSLLRDRCYFFLLLLCSFPIVTYCNNDSHYSTAVLLCFFFLFISYVLFTLFYLIVVYPLLFFFCCLIQFLSKQHIHFIVKYNVYLFILVFSYFSPYAILTPPSVLFVVVVFLRIGFGIFFVIFFFFR